MKVYDAPNIRNVALVGHGGSGTTSLASALLFNGGAVNRLGRVEDGTTITDFDPDEVERQISLQTALAYTEWNKTKINLLDAPGYANFVAEARAALRVADAALVTAVVRGGPAAESGLRVQDFILAVDGERVTGWSGDALVKRAHLALANANRCGRNRVGVAA